MKNIDTDRVYDIRDVVWLQRMFHVKPEGQLSIKIKVIPEVEDIYESIMETEDDLSASEIIEEAKLLEGLEKLITDTITKVVDTTIASENKHEEHFPRTSRLRRVIRCPNRLVESNTAAVNAENVSEYLKLVRELIGMKFDKKEFRAVGAEIVDGFTHTTELRC